MKEWIFGRNPVYEVLKAKRRRIFELKVSRNIPVKGRIKEIIQLFTNTGLSPTWVSRHELDAINGNHQGVILQTTVYPYGGLPDIIELARKRDEHLFILILDSLNDPQNFGTLLRTAEAVGVHGVIIPLRRSVKVTPAVVSASSGASDHLIIIQSNLAQVIRSLKEIGVWIMGLADEPTASRIDQADLSGPIAIVVGSEGSGMRQLVKDSCDLVIRIPMRGQIGSLNAAVAGSIGLYHTLQKRGFNSN